MARRLNIGFNQGPATLLAQTIKYGLMPARTSFGVGAPVLSGQRYNPGWTVATLPSQTNGWGGSGTGALGLDSGTVLNPWPGAGTINYANGSIPGGHTGTLQGLNPATDGPTLIVSGNQLVQGIVQRYGWYELEPSKNSYVFQRMDADFAQCIALGVWWYPMVVTRTFTNNQIPYPNYLSSFVDPVSGGGYQMRRWDLVNVAPRFQALLTQIGQRYDAVSTFGGIATQETAAAGATNYTIANYLQALKLEADAINAASPHSRQMAYQNFIPGDATGSSNAYTDMFVDQYAAYVQQYGAILTGPDLVISGGVVNRCYPRYHAYRFGGTVTQSGQTPTVFSGKGPTGLALQNDEWAFTGHGAVQSATAIADAFAFGIGGSSSGLKIDYCPIDYHTNAGNPNNQKWNNAGTNLIKANPAAFGTFTP